MKLIAIIGPTGIGKTAFSIALAQKLKTEIISCDSRQFYREMNIGTAKPSISELVSVKHHFINSLSIKDEYSVGDFERDALRLLDRLFKKYENVIMVGGSMLYERALTEGLNEFPKVDAKIRDSLNLQWKNEGIESLQNQLQKVDPEYYKIVDIQNPHRLIRALEISLATGRSYSSFLNKAKPQRSFEVQKIGLYAERERVYERINQRVDIMREEGLTQEAYALFPFKSYNALQTIGYQELFNSFEGRYTEDTAYEEIKKNSRRYAKRQLTWYRKDDSIAWQPYDKFREALDKF